jgi:sugar O-acyltransferase (sialic acid O-acetyltransferase NeuD family)
LLFVDYSPSAGVVNGHPVCSYTEFLTIEATQRHVVIAIANSAIRQKLALRLHEDGVQAWSVQAANVVTMDDVLIGEGALLSPFVSITSNIQIGKHFHANIYSYVAHDCVIGDFVTFAPGVKCNGNIVIEDHAYIGTGAVIKQGLPGRPLVIGRGAVVGMGAVVTKDVAPGVTVVGNPARPLVKG